MTEADEMMPLEDMDDDERLRDYVKKVDYFYTNFAEHLERARNYLRFLYVDQWEASDRQNREIMGRPTMQFNKLVTIIRGITGEQRMNSPSLTVRGVGHKVSQKTVDVYEGLLRYIHYKSDADIAYQIASNYGLECGWGAVRVCIEYEGPDTFKKCLRIKPIMDYSAAFWDPTAQLLDKSDGDYCGVHTVMSREHFKRIYPKVDLPENTSTMANNYFLMWCSRETVMVCELYVKDYYDKVLVKMSDGKEMPMEEAKELLKLQDEFLKENPDAVMFGYEMLEIVDKRKCKDCNMKHIKFVYGTILEEVDYPGKILPVVYFEGDSAVIDGERIPVPYIQDAIDTQRMINYIGSEIAYAILRCRKETVMGTVDNFAGQEDQWRNPDLVQGPLTYTTGKKGEKPEFISPPVFNPTLSQEYQNRSQDMSSILGRYDEVKGAQTNATTSVAIRARQEAASLPANVYNDNWVRGIKQIGKCLMELIPHVYNDERDLMIIKKDGQAEAVTVNKQNGYEFSEEDSDFMPKMEHDLTVGEYDIEIRVDGSFDAQTQRALETLLKLATLNPAIGNLIPDLIAENSGLENTEQVVERLKTLVPPQILAKEEGRSMPPPQPPPPDPRLEIEQQRNQINAAGIQTKNKQIALDEQKLILQSHQAGLEHETKMAKAMAEIKKAEVDKDIAKITHGAAIAKAHASGIASFGKMLQVDKDLTRNI